MEDMFRIDPGVSCSEAVVEFHSFGPATGFQERVDNAINASTATTATATVILPFESNDSESARGSSEMRELIKTQIANHPRYPNLVSAYIECRKVGAPPEVASLLDEISRSRPTSAGVCSEIGADPELDEFMESYCKVLLKYKEELSKPFDEATSFLSNIETQLLNLCKGIPPATSATCHPDEVVGSSEEEEQSCGEVVASESPESSATRPGDQELKEMLMRKYSGYLSSLRKEFLKKRKKGKLPKDARMLLLDWWNTHYRWPYPTEEEKTKLAESTGLDQKQINNWFINQRKRHWKPSEDMRFAVMEGVSGSVVPLPCGDNLRNGCDDLNGV